MSFQFQSAILPVCFFFSFLLLLPTSDNQETDLEKFFQRSVINFFDRFEKMNIETNQISSFVGYS